MALEESGMARPDAQTLPHAVPEDEARVEHRNHRPLPRHELLVYPDEDALVARVVLEVVRAVRHAPNTLEANDRPADACGGRPADATLPNPSEGIGRVASITVAAFRRLSRRPSACCPLDRAARRAAGPDRPCG